MLLIKVISTQLKRNKIDLKLAIMEEYLVEIDTAPRKLHDESAHDN